MMKKYVLKFAEIINVTSKRQFHRTDIQTDQNFLKFGPEFTRDATVREKIE